MKVVVLALLLLSGVAIAEPAPVFQQAQLAASEGRFQDVVNILTRAIESDSLSGNDVAIAYSNRGIAYSLLKQYGPAVSDLRRAIRLYPTHQLSLNHLGILAEHIEQDYAAAAEWYGQAGDLGYSVSKVNLGNLYRLGLGVPLDYAEALRLFEEAHAEGYAAAAVYLGEMYLDGYGVEKDYAKAVALLEAGVEAGVVTGYFSLGRASENGWGVRRDYQRAMTNYRMAAAEGHAPSQGAVGYLFRMGYGVERNYMEAARWYRLAAEQGDVKATNRLAWLLATCPVPDVCDGRLAIDYATLAVEADPSTTNFDTLAAGHARAGEFDRAITIIRELLALELSEETRNKFIGRLDRYLNGIPYQL